MKLEPGEWDQVHFDFVLPGDVEVIILYSHFVNRKHRNELNRKHRNELGWSQTTLCDLRSYKGQTMSQLPGGPRPSAPPLIPAEPAELPRKPDPRELPRKPDPKPPPPEPPKAPTPPPDK